MRAAIATLLLAGCDASYAHPDAAPVLDPIAWSRTIGTGTATSVIERPDGAIVVTGGGDTLVAALVSADGTSAQSVDTQIPTPLGSPTHAIAVRADNGVDIASFDRLVRIDEDFAVVGEPTFAPSGESWHSVMEDANGTLVCGTSDDGDPLPLVTFVDNAGAIDPAKRYVSTTSTGTVLDCAADAFTGRNGTHAILGRLDAPGRPDTTLGSDGFLELPVETSDARALVPLPDGYLLAGSIDGDLGAIVVRGDGTVASTVVAPIAADHATGFAATATAIAGTTSVVSDPKLTESAVVRLESDFTQRDIVHFPTGTRLFAMTALRSGDLVVAGDVGGGSELFIARVRQ